MEINNAWKFSWQYQRAIRELTMNERILNMLLHSDKKASGKLLNERISESMTENRYCNYTQEGIFAGEHETRCSVTKEEIWEALDSMGRLIWMNSMLKVRNAVWQIFKG